MRTEKILRKLTDEIAEVYNLDLAERMTETYEDLVKKIKATSKQYWSLAGKLATIEKQRDELRNKFNDEQMKNRSTIKSFDAVGELYKKQRELYEKSEEGVGCLSKELEEERDARTQAESEIEWLKRELEEERRLRVDAEYDKEYYAMQLMEHMD